MSFQQPAMMKSVRNQGNVVNAAASATLALRVARPAVGGARLPRSSSSKILAIRRGLLSSLGNRA